jgi:osmotically-inducible protein OsmY
MFARPLSILFVLLALTGAASAARAQSRSDLRIAEDVGRSLSTHSQLSIFDDVRAEVLDGTVTLSGKVTAEHKRSDVARAIGRVDGVRQVRNQIALLSSTPYDDELRYRVSRAIYSNAAFWPYANMPRPPIHVIVDHGRVTLTGVVATDAERALARSLATGNGEVSVACELRTVSTRSGQAETAAR